MKVVILQRDLAWGDPETNIKGISQALDRNPGADLYVLPEMFTTGFATQDDARLDEDPERTIDWMKAEAAEKNAAIAGSIAMRDGEICVNRFYFVKPDGEVTKYDKHHLFNYGGEGKRFTPGSERVIVEWRGVKFLLLVCYDLRFPVWSRNSSSEGYDAIICVANWPTARQDAWETLVKARAIENECFIIAVNRIGRDPVCEYMGGSVVYNPFGMQIARCEDYAQCEAAAELQMNILTEFRKKFPVLEDADKFVLL